jgi:tetratricopeptide (TPR) repeat protein/tRNA A-37 threonylcarbamoyl transferase component Bud32
MNERSIFVAALDLDDPAERAAYLDRSCTGDTDLRQRVERLLQAHAAAGSFLRAPAVAVETTDGPAPETILPPPASEGPGSRLGPYTLLDKLGEGGMGAVYLAEQEHPVRRRVALKVIKPGMDSAPVVARFEQERQALALMDHPHIARVFDAGTTDAGRPFFVMELVKGVPITRYCDEHRCGLRERLELFVLVCNAVQHAHHKGIVHRDLKPSNVLVTRSDDRPVPKVIDFGIAKALDQRLTDKTVHTGLGQIIGTLEYMSPEQARLDALDVDTRSDVYALGVLLYELLTGSTPFERPRLHGAGLDEALRIIREEEPVAPGRRHTGAAPAALRIAHFRELDWIVMKCLDKDPGRRYATANALAQDVQHYLRDEPVVAGPPSAGYRLRKFARRHRGWLAAAAALAVTLVLGSAVSLWEAVRATRAEKAVRQERDAAVAERARADEEAAIARAISDFVTRDILRQAGPGHQGSATHNPDRDLKVRTALDRAAQNIAGKFSGRPRVEAALRDAIGSAYWELGEADRAVAQLEAAVARAREALGEEHHDTLTYLNNLALVYQYQGRSADAEPLLVKAYEVGVKVEGPEHPSTLTFMNNLGHLYRDQGRFDKAEPLLSGALELRRRVLGEDQPDTLVTADKLAGLYQLRGEYERAEPILVRTLAARRRVLGDEHPETLGSVNNLGLVYRYLGRFDEAEPLLLEALEQTRKVSGEDHLHTLICLCNVALVYRDQGKYDKALPIFTDALRHSRKKLGEKHPSTLLTASNLAGLYQYQGRYDEAEDLFTETAGYARQALGDDHLYTFSIRRNLALLYQERKKHDRAERLLAELLAARRRRDGADHPRVAGLLAELGESILEQGRPAEAEPLLREALQIRVARQPQHWLRFATDSLLGACLTGRQHYADAEPLVVGGYEGLRTREQNMPAEAKKTLTAARERIARLYDAWGRPEQAARWRPQREAVLPGPKEDKR